MQECSLNHALAALCCASLCACSADDSTRAIERAVAIGAPGMGQGHLHQPRAVEVLPADGSCVVIDRSGRIQRYSERGEILDAWFLPEWRDGQPIALTLSPWGTLLVSDTHYHRILEYDLDGGELRRFGTGVGLELVRGIASGDDIIYVADYGAEDRIHRFDRAGRHLGSFGRRGDGPGEFLRPEGLALGADGHVFVADCGHHRILRFSPAGDFVAAFGGAGSGPGSFLFPFDVAAGSADTLYVVDYKGSRVQRFTADGRFLGAAGGAGLEPGRFAAPRGLAVRADPAGDIIWVADTNNHRLQRFRWEHDL